MIQICGCDDILSLQVFYQLFWCFY